MKAQQNLIIVTQPKPLQKTGSEFLLRGSVSESWLMTSWGAVDNRIFIEYMDINGKTFMGGSLVVFPPKGFRRLLTKMYQFSVIRKFDPLNVPSIENSQGRITLKIYGHNEDEQSIFIPLIIPEFVPDGPVELEIIEKHLNVGKKVTQLRNSLKKYNEELKSLYDREEKEFKENFVDDPIDWVEIEVDQLLDGIGRRLYSAESDEKRALDDKYKEALEWRGPLARGIAGRLNGYAFKVYSHDHGQHFHVIHRQQRIDARFSFPEIQLINYKNTRNLIGSKEIKSIQSFFEDTVNFKKLSDEFKKRI